VLGRRLRLAGTVPRSELVRGSFPGLREQDGDGPRPRGARVKEHPGLPTTALRPTTAAYLPARPTSCACPVCG